MIKSTCVHFVNSADSVLKILSEQISKPTARKKVLDIIRKLHVVYESEFISIDDVMENCSLGRSTVSNVFTWLVKHKWVIVGLACDKTYAHKSVKLISFKAIEDLTDLLSTDVGVPIITEQCYRIASIDGHIPHDVLTPEMLPERRAVLPYNKRFSNLTSPGREIINKIECIEYSPTGEAYTNSAESTIGVVNDYDFKVLENLFALTHLQIISNPNLFVQDSQSDLRFTIRMVDILKIGDYHDDERREISASIDRIRHSIFTFKQNDYLGHIEMVQSERFSFLSHMVGVSAKMGSIDDSVHPYIAIAIGWDSAIVKYLTTGDRHFVIGSRTSLLTPLLNRVYLYLRNVHFAKTSDFTIGSKFTIFENDNLDLITLVQLVWGVKSRNFEVDYRAIVKDLIGELKLKKIGKITREKNINDKSAYIVIDLLGFEIAFDIQDYQCTRYASNCYSKVYIKANMKVILESSGVKYSGNRSTLPAVKNELANLFATGKSKRIILPDHIKEIEKDICIINSRSQYYIKFEVFSLGQEFTISNYHTLDEIYSIFEVVATATKQSFDSVSLFFESKRSKLKPLRNLTMDEFKYGMGKTGLSKIAFIDFIFDNIRSIDKLKGQDWASWRDYLHGK